MEKAKKLLESYRYAAKLAIAESKEGACLYDESEIIYQVQEILREIPLSRGKYYIELRYIYDMSVDEICKAEFISRVTFYKYVKPILAEIETKLNSI